MRILLVSFTLSLLVSVAPVSAQTGSAGSMQADARDSEGLVGLWKAKRRFGPDERGTLVIERTSQGWAADFLGRRWSVAEKDGVLTFALPANRASFRARLEADGRLVNGQWFQLASTVAPNFGTGIAFRPVGQNRWTGEVRPVDEEFTLYLMAQRQADGTIAAFIRNPERNIGLNLGVQRLEIAGDSVRLVGRRLGRSQDETVMAGSYDAASGVLRLTLSDRGAGSFDFRREGDDSNFWPRGRKPDRYVYQPPLARDDGWPTGTLEQANIDRGGIESFIQWLIEMPMDSVSQPEVHGILIARGGRLVLEEYFHGYDRDRLHDTRSAAKSLTATLVGAVLQARHRLRLTDSVYKIMNGGSFPPNLEPRKQAMQLQHLLTMSSGIHCDDGDENAPGNENAMLDQAREPDYWHYYLAMPMDRNPGERSIYCSGDPNLAIGVLTRATGEHAMDLFERHLARPLGIERHGWYLSPSRQPYGGGSVQILPRDFLKVGQTMANGGTWNGRRILSREFVERASADLCPLNRIGYGYQWWTLDYPYKNRRVTAYFAGGNGGQGIFVIPELDLVIGIFGGSYTSRVGLEIQQGYIPRYILPAVREEGDRLDEPVKPRDYEVVYGRERPAPPCPQSAYLRG